ncbi:MAG: RHS repeat-associated core domain-containing protein [Planctomycetota bacterium]|jgi:RHS repeat-associated protein
MNGPILVSSYSLSTDSWYHIVATYDGGVITLYVNGSNNGSRSDAPSSIDYDGLPLYLGRLSCAAYYPFSGALDDVRIYDRALSSDEVVSLYYQTDVIVHYGYDALSRRVTAQYANGTTATYDNDIANRLENLYNQTQTGNHNFAYTYDKVGNRLTMTANVTEQHSYTYDDIHQLTGVDYPAGYFTPDTTFNYDPAGNRQWVTSGGLTTYERNQLNQYTSVAKVAYGYDDNGNLTGDGTNAYTYDAENRLTGVTNLSATYTYDAQGRRVSKTVDGIETRYVYDGDQVICEYDGSGRLIRKFVYGTGIDEPVRMAVLDPPADIGGGDGVDIDDLRTMAGAWLEKEGQAGYNAAADLSFDGKIDNVDSDILAANWQSSPSAWAPRHYYYHYDGLGSVVALTDSAGNTVEKYAYDVYGAAIIRDTHDEIRNTSSVGNPYFFTARRFDTETNLYYFRARYYSPNIGRFLQTDPIGYQGGINLYTYCGNNPIIFVDPYGLCAESGGPSYLSEPTLRTRLLEDVIEWIDAIEFCTNYLQDPSQLALNDKYRHMYVSYKLSEMAGPTKARVIGLANEILLDFPHGEGFNLGDDLSNKLGIEWQQAGIPEDKAIQYFEAAAPVIDQRFDLKIELVRLPGPLIQPP